jgi:hypothetical protein
MTLDVRSLDTAEGPLVRSPPSSPSSSCVARRACQPTAFAAGAASAGSWTPASDQQDPNVGRSIGVNRGLIRLESYVALVAADLVSVVAFPVVATVISSPKLAATRTDRRVRWRSRSHSSGETPNAP